MTIVGRENMNRFHVYLLPELSKLRNKGDAENFLSKVKEDDLRRFKISTSVDELIKQFNSQDAIIEYINKLSNDELKLLSKLLSKEWRRNPIYDKLTRYFIWEEKEIPIDIIYVQQAEPIPPSLVNIFKKHNFKLLGITNDSELWEYKPYNSDFSKGRKVEFPLCLAEKIDESKYIIFDGIHRAIQMARNGQQYINLYYAKD